MNKERINRLYAYLVANEGKTFEQLELAEALDYPISTNDKAHDKVTSLWNDINYINCSPEYEKIILQDNFKYKVATENEAKEYCANFKLKALKSFKRYWSLVRKIDSNNQIQLTGEIIESFAKEINA